MPLELTIGHLDQLPLSQSRLDEYFGPWQMEETSLQTLCHTLSALSASPTGWSAHVAAHQARQAARQQELQAAAAGGEKRKIYPVLNGTVAVVDLFGMLMKQESSMEDSTSTIWARRQIRAAAADEAIKAILLRADTPGGTSAGMAELFDDIVEASRLKLVEAAIEDCCCSAGFYAVCGSSRITMNRSGVTGSIGTYMVMYDMTARAAQQGIKVHLIREGDMKGAGVPGTEIKAEHLAEWQRRVRDANSHFLAAVGQGRKLSAERVRELADGRTHSAADAVKLGLIDGIGSFEQTLAAVTKRVQTISVGRMNMSTNAADPNVVQTTTTAPAAPAAAQPAAQPTATLPVAQPVQPAAAVATQPPRQAATAQELKQACPGASGEFLFGQLEKGATTLEAMQAFITFQNEKLAAVGTAPTTAVPPKKPGHTMPVEPTKPAATAATGSATEQFQQAVAEQMEKGKITKQEATKLVCKKQPELHAAMLNETNAAQKRPANFAA